MQPTFDAHIHLWQRPYPGLSIGTLRSGSRDQLEMMLALMDRNGVQKACVVAACVTDNQDNHEFVAEVCSERHDRLIMFSEIPLAGPRRDELLDRSINRWPARGFRYTVQNQTSQEQLTGTAMDAFWTKVNEAGLLVCLNYGPEHTVLLPPLVERWPKIRWILDHLGQPRHDMTDAQYAPVLALARYPNVYVKVSGFYAFTADSAEYPYPDVFRFVVALRDAYGPQRLMWASDVPPVLEHSSYRQTYRCLEHIGQLGPSDRKWILGQAAEKLFA